MLSFEKTFHFIELRVIEMVLGINTNNYIYAKATIEVKEKPDNCPVKMEVRKGVTISSNVYSLPEIHY